MVHVCFIGHNIHFLSSASGSAVLPREVIKCLYRDVEASLITIENGKTYKRELQEKTDPELVNCLRHLKFIKAVPVKENYRFLQIIKHLNELHGIIKDENIDIAHVFEIPSLALPFIHRLFEDKDVKIIYHTYMPISKINGLAKAIFLRRFTDAVITTSPYIFHQSFRELVKERATCIIPPPIDTSIYKPLAGDLLSFTKSGITLLYIGPLEHQRLPLKPIINTIRHLCVSSLDMKLIIVASPRYRDDMLRIQLLRRIATKSGIEKNLEIIYGRLASKKKILFYRNADAVIFPFLKSYRGAVDPPLTLLEAMACGGLLIATDALSIPWVIEDGYNGFLCPNCVRLGDVVRKTIKMTDTYKSFIRNRAIKTIRERFSSSTIRNQILSFYDKIMTTSKVEF